MTRTSCELRTYNQPSLFLLVSLFAHHNFSLLLIIGFFSFALACSLVHFIICSVAQLRTNFNRSNGATIYPRGEHRFSEAMEADGRKETTAAS